jgi:hypothetical protein
VEKTPSGTSVGVDDPYAYAGVCDFCTGDGRCRYAHEYAAQDEDFAAARRADDFRCPAADPEAEWDWRDCPHYRSTTGGRTCARCGLEERRDAHARERPLLEEHHLSYADGSEDGPGNESENESQSPNADGDGTETASGDGSAPAHEITVALCRWCHAKVHGSWARIDDDAAPDPEALAAREGRRSREQAELGFETARERRDEDG